VTAHSQAAGLDLHEDKRIKQPVRVAAITNVSLSSPGASIDGVSLSTGDRVLLTGQTAPAENGIRIWSGASSLLQRASDAASNTDFVYGFKVYVREGTASGASYWTFTQSAAVTVDTTALTFAKDGAGSGEIVGTDFKPSGLTGATQASRYVGATTSGAPASGSFVVGDFIVDQSGFVWICTSAGTPGTWTLAGFHNPMTTTGDLIVGGSSGTPSRLAASSTTGQVLTSNGAGVAPTYQTPTGGSGGGGTGGTGGSIVPIQTQTPSGVGTIAFAVPSGFRNLRITGTARSTRADVFDTVNIQFNGDTGSNYNSQRSYSTGTGSAGSNIGAAQVTGGTSGLVAWVSAANSLANTAAGFVIDIPNHAGTTFFKGWVGHDAEVQTGSATGVQENITGGYWASANAITSVTLLVASGNFVAGSTITLWGEADTGPVLLTSNSNLIQETILTATQATIPIPNIPQGYRDLRVEILARSDQATSFVNLGLQFNGDTGSNYAYNSSYAASNAFGSAGGQGTAQAQAYFNMATPGSSAQAGYFGKSSLHIPDYSRTTTSNKVASAYGGVFLATSAGNVGVDIGVAFWASTAPITSITLLLSAGNFIAGTVVRVYGEPAASAGPSVGTGTRLRLGGNQSITTATATAITWDTEDNDADNQHFTSAANLTGTLTKTASSSAVTGSSTAFLTELSVGQVISIPGTAAEKRVVIAIASNTALTVNTPFVNSASGQTAVRVNTAVVFRQPGFYSLETNIYSGALSTGAVTLAYYLNSLTTATSGTAIGERDPIAVNASAGYDLVIQRQFQQWDFVEVVWTQNSGGSVNVLADERTHFSISARPTVIVAVPYANIQDQKAQNTAGGTFTSGAFQTRTLNTVVSDSAGIISLSSNAFTLGPGTYRTECFAPAYGVASHQLRLRNTTDSTTVLTGISARANVSADVVDLAALSGRFTITASKTFELQHQAQTTRSSDGFGVAANFGTEVYAVVELWKEG